MVTKHHCISK